MYTHTDLKRQRNQKKNEKLENPDTICVSAASPSQILWRGVARIFEEHVNEGVSFLIAKLLACKNILGHFVSYTFVLIRLSRRTPKMS